MLIGRCTLPRLCGRRSQSSSTKIYDYVVVGGGSAGCVLANRLSKNPETKVCLLEAGPEDASPFIKVPSLLGFLLNYEKEGKVRLTSDYLNWAFDSEPEPACDNRCLFQPRGRALGGSSSINAMLYVRGHKEDYNDWERLGNRGWGWKDVLPVFKRMENSHRGAGEYHGDSGELYVEPHRTDNMKEPSLYSHILAATSKELGIPIIDDCNTGETEGAMYYDRTVHDGVRFSSASAFLHPIRNRPNLDVITGAHAARVVLNGKRAEGVEYLHVTGSGVRKGKNTEIVKAGHVILSAGAFQSPQLLLLSGIGPKEEVEGHGIELRHHLPGVGGNLLDHVDIAVADSFDTSSGLFNGSLTLTDIPRFVREYYKWKSGGEERIKCFLSGVPAEAGGFFKSSPSESRPDMQLHFANAIYKNHGRDKFLFTRGFMGLVCVLYPESKGTVGLKSKDPMVSPRIRPNYFASERDLDKLSLGLEKLEQIMNSPELDKIRKRRVFPTTEETKTHEQRKEAIRKNAETIYHPVGTCKMGNDNEAVVSDRLAVHGIEGLTVCDASIYPTIIGGNTNAPTMMVADRWAELHLTSNA